MELIKRFAEDSKSKLITRPERRTDRFLGIMRAIAEFESRLNAPMAAEIDPLDPDLSPISSVYNDAISRIMMDINAIRDHQIEIMNGLLSSWNAAEQIVAPVEIPKIDKEFPVLAARGKSNGHITLGVRSVRSAIPSLKNPPSLNATSTDSTVPITYGKAYGLFVIGNETGEDGIRPNDNDGSKVIDARDTFWEAEAVTLQEEQGDGIFSPADVNINELSLTVNISLTFTNQVNMNFFSIDPHSFSQSVYFDITGINLISGSKSIPIIKEPVNVSQKVRITFETTPVNAVQVTLRQNKGYFEKYSLAKYVIGNNEAWLDFTGPQLISRIDTHTGDVNKAIRDEIEDASNWISAIWVPDAPANESAVLDVTAGNGGYAIVESTESKRKRWAIGIQEIEFGEEVYEDVSEVVTTEFDMPDETTSIYLIADEELTPGSEISYSLSFDDGSSWQTISPINRQPELLESGYLVPQRLSINSDISLERKENSPTGVDGFVNTARRKVRARAILKKSSTGVNTPRITDFYPVFDTSVPIE